jgi:hypothetical protein
MKNIMKSMRFELAFSLTADLLREREMRFDIVEVMIFG